MKAKEYTSSQEVKWCPGCGDYAVINSMKKALSELELKKEDVVFVSGIGCSSRFPYYIDTYGFHTIHGRPLAIASGTKIANPDLSVWVISGDGDALAIGGNHFIHAIRRNINLNLILFNNEIYGLTKGQYSPTSEKGIVTKSSPHGTIETPFLPAKLALGAGSNFFARVPDTEGKLMTQIIIQAEKHKGLSMIEVLQNCVIFNDKTHSAITDKENKKDNQIVLEHGKAMVFGKENNKGLILNALKLEVVTIGENGVAEDDILIHDAHCESNILHNLLLQMSLPELPVAMGVIREVSSSVYDDALYSQIQEQKEDSKFSNLDELFLSGNVFEQK